MADKDYNIAIKLLTQNFSTRLKGAEDQIRKFAKSSAKDFEALNKSAAKTKNILSGNWELLGGFVAGAAIYEAARKVAEFDHSLMRMRIDASLSSKETLELKSQIMSLGQATGVSDQQILKLSESSLKSSKSYKFTRDNLAFLTTAMQASGASGEALGEAMGEIYEKTGITGQALQDLVGNLYSFGKTSARESTFKDLLPKMGTMIKNFKAANPKASFKEIQNYMMQSMFVSDPEALTKAIRKMNTSGALKYMKSLGINITKAVSINDVVSKVKSNFTTRAAQLAALSNIFGKGSLEFAKLLDQQDEYNEAIKKVDATQIFSDANAEASTFDASMNRLNNAILQISDASLAPVLSEITEALNGMDPASIDMIAKSFGTLATWVVWLLDKVGKSLQGIGALSEMFGFMAAGKSLPEAAQMAATNLNNEIDAAKAKKNNIAGLNSKNSSSSTGKTSVDLQATHNVYINGEKQKPVRTESTVKSKNGHQLANVIK